MRLDIAHRSRPCRGETANGDAVWLGEWIHRPVFAVFDASGHGAQAAEAARAACGVLDRWDGTPDLPALAARLHQELRGSRGSAGLVALLDHPEGGPATLRGFGVGNVELRALDRTISALLTPGILGVRLRRRIHVFEIPLQVGDRLMAFSDGIRGRFFDREYHQGLSPAALCDSLLRDHGRPHDDATVLVADVLDDA
ncbi:SpoIIE family protein phosphatase [Paraliomyxa miuraensis]|uniref:SpoIIE family protein phosphatase n=1 Tax=Paraliomyxa miuraensis TaxID=376150 RepID=UPI0022578DD8|nr:SpoIIE family protein phosphatase [Paraliomyxa miuraensis]MCX4239263.1 serine/threonine-protein phosphatase [Paraliomyxa miuraensis]